MTIPTFILKNALRNKRPAALSILSVAVRLFLLVTLQVALREWTNPISDEGSSLRIIVRNKVSLAQPLPARQLQTLERMPGVMAVSPFTFYGGVYKGDEKFTSFAQFAVDQQRTLSLIDDTRGPPEQLAAWMADRTSCLVGRMTADRYGLKIGHRMQFTGQIYPCDLELKIAGIYHGTADDRNVMFHHKYLDEALGNPGTVGTWWVRAASIDEAPLVTDRINEAFANTSAGGAGGIGAGVRARGARRRTSPHCCLPRKCCLRPISPRPANGPRVRCSPITGSSISPRTASSTPNTRRSRVSCSRPSTRRASPAMACCGCTSCTTCGCRQNSWCSVPARRRSAVRWPARDSWGSHGASCTPARNVSWPRCGRWTTRPRRRS